MRKIPRRKIRNAVDNWTMTADKKKKKVVELSVSAFKPSINKKKVMSWEGQCRSRDFFFFA